MDEKIWFSLPDTIITFWLLLMCFILMRQYLVFKFIKKVAEEDLQLLIEKTKKGEPIGMQRFEKLHNIRWLIILQFWKWPLSKYLQEIEGERND